MKENHEIVKVDIVEETSFVKPNPKSLYQKTETISGNGIPSICIQLADFTLDIPESVNPAFLSQVLQAVRYHL